MISVLAGEHTSAGLVEWSIGHYVEAALENFRLRAHKSLSERSFLVENPDHDDLPAFIKRGNLTDAGQFANRWIRRNFEQGHRGYADIFEYQFDSLDTQGTVGWESVRELFRRGRIPHATVRELVAFWVSNRAAARAILKAGYTINAFGNDEFNLSGADGACLRNGHPRLRLESVPNVLGGTYSSKDLFLTRCPS